MKIICSILMLFMCANVHTKELDLNCLSDAYLGYTKKVSDYWLIKDTEFKKSYPDMHKDFSYLNAEQMNHNRMQEITIYYLINAYPKELNLNGSLYSMVPRYKHFAQKIYRELRSNPEFNQLYLDIESYKKENMMPNFEALKKASEILTELDKLPAVKKAMDAAVKQSQVMVSSLLCGS